MGKMKDYAMDISVELGFGGVLNDDVMHEGQGRLDGKDVPVAVRTGSGTYIEDSTEFSDTVDRIRRVPREHASVLWVVYKGKQYRLGGGSRTQYFICLNDPIL